MRIIRFGAAGLAAIVLAGCGTTAATEKTRDTTTAESVTAESAAVTTATQAQDVTEALASKKAAHEVVASWDEADVVEVALSDSVDGTVTITDPGTYRLSGSLAGQVVVHSESDLPVQLILDGVDITSETGAAIAITAAEEVVVILADGSVNTLTDSVTYADTSTDAPNAALWSADDMTIAGTGSLTVTGRSNDGIASKDGLVIEAGDITVDAVDDGIRGKDYLVVEGGTITVSAGGHALKSDNTDDSTVGYVALLGGAVELTSGEDGVNAQYVIVGASDVTVDAVDDGLHADGDMVIGDGTISIVASYEGLEAATMAISGGTIDIVADDDGINIAGGADSSGAGGPGGGDQFAANSDHWVAVTGGTITIDAQGDGFDSNGYATMSGGTLTVHGPTGNGNGAIDVNGTFEISGGTLVAGGSSGMAEAPEASSAQGWASVTFNGSVAAGTTVELVGDGVTVASYTAEKTFGSVVFSTAEIVSGAQYEVVVDGQSVGTVTAGQHVGGMGGGGPRG